MLRNVCTVENMTDKFEHDELVDWTDEEDETLRRLVNKRLSMRRSKGHDLKFVADMLDGESHEKNLASILNGSIEVKADKAAQKTGNIYVEVTDRGKPSGINTTTAEWQAQFLTGKGFDSEVVVLIRTERLRNMVEGKRTVNGGDASTGVLVKLTTLMEPIDNE